MRQLFRSILGGPQAPLKLDIPMCPVHAIRIPTAMADRCLQQRAFHLHIAAIVTVYGPIPDEVSLSFEADRHSDVKAFASSPLSSSTGIDWIMAANAGLSKWSEAHFADPVDVHINGAETMMTLATYRDVTSFAISHLRRKAMRVRNGEDFGRLYDNLAQHLERYGRDEPSLGGERADG